LTIGTTGHIDLHPDDVPLLEKRVGEYFARLQRQYPHTPLQVLSALAEGADRLVARVALKRGIKLIAPLPLPQEEYEKDFELAKSKQDFRDLLAGRRVVVVSESAANRDDAYARLGAWLAHNSQIILALWDESDNHKHGGTADVVRLKRGELRPGGQQLLDPSDTGPVHVIHARRAGEQNTADVGKENDLYPRNYGSNEVAAETFETICRRTEELNADAVASAKQMTKARQTSRGYLMSTLRDAAAVEPLAPTIELYTFADTLAGSFQRRTIYALRTLFVLVFLAVMSFALFAHEAFGRAPERPLLITYLLLFLAAWLVHLWASWRRYQDRYLEYRALAEALRVQFYWYVAAIDDSAADRCLPHQSYELDWIRNTLRAAELAAEQRPAFGVGGLQHALEGWVVGQRDYFRSTVEREETAIRTRNWIVRILIAVGVATAVGGAFYWRDRPCDDQGHKWFILAIAIPTAAAALWHGYGEKRALEGHMKRYGRALVVFENAREQIEQHLAGNDEEAARGVFRDLGGQALAENGDWVILHRDRPLEVPQPG
jgi:hypothetical protein